MSKKSPGFVEETLLYTPQPVHSSSFMSSEKTAQKKGRKLEDLARTYSLDPSEELQLQRTLAAKSLHRLETITNLTSLPSRFLKPTELSSINSKDYFSPDSTISESDLLPPESSSTPRESLLSNAEFVMSGRRSTGNMLTKLAHSMRDNSYDFDKILEEVQRTVDTETSFCSGDEAVVKLMRDELSWKKENFIPDELKEFSGRLSGTTNYSMGSYFKKKSESISEWKVKSPEKNEGPTPLIEETTSEESTQNESLSISKIAQILSDSKHTPTKALNVFMNNKKKTMKENSPPIIEEEEEEIIDDNNETASTLPLYEEATKENVDTLNLKQPSPEYFYQNKSQSSSRSSSALSTLHKQPSPDYFYQNKSPSSSRSSSALSSLPPGKLPLKSTKSEVIWGCLKPGKSQSQDFIIRNQSSSKIGLKLSISNPSFRLIKEGSDSTSTMKVILHPFESKTFTVNFTPSSVGAAIANIEFTSINSTFDPSSGQFMRLYGYGGYGNITINNIPKDTTGKFLLSLGNLENQKIVEKKFVIKNTGILPAFSRLTFISSGLHLFSNVNITPKALVLLPGEEKEVLVTYSPKREDLVYIQSKSGCSVVELGQLTMAQGTEVDRGRLRKLCKRAQEKGVGVDQALINLTAEISGEVMPRDLKHFKEHLTNLDQLLRLISSKEIVLTLEQDLDRTLVDQLHNETEVFYSLCEDTALEKTIKGDFCYIEPTKIILTPPGKLSDMIFLSNNGKKKLYFEVKSSPVGLKLNPDCGTAKVEETVVIRLMYTEKCKGKTEFKVKIYVDNECYDVDVKVVPLGLNA